MDVARITGATRVLNAPPGWDKDSNGPCRGLPIRDQKLIGGVNVMVSAWQPSENEVEALRQGASLQMHVVGTAHPPVMLAVGEPPEITEAEVDAEIARILAMSEEEVLAMSTPIDLGLGRLMKSQIGALQKVVEARRAAQEAEIDRDRLAAELAAARAEVEALQADKARLDYLDNCNAALNAHYGTSYRWRLVLTHNVTRLMLGSGDVDLHDSDGANTALPSCREAIDERIRERDRARAARITGGTDAGRA